jgi:hypothetical protein
MYWDPARNRDLALQTQRRRLSQSPEAYLAGMGLSSLAVDMAIDGNVYVIT